MTKTNILLVTCCSLFVVVSWLGCSGGVEDTPPADSPGPTLNTPTNQQTNTTPQGDLILTSSAFEQGKPIPKKHTADGDDVSPELKLPVAPQGTKSWAIICDDPDAPSPKSPGPQPWVHWVIYNIPSDVSTLPEGIDKQAELSAPSGARQGRNGWSSGNVGYRGPEPPKGSGTHRYFFKIYALDSLLELPAEQADKASLLAAMQGHILAEGELIGTYQRK